MHLGKRAIASWIIAVIIAVAVLGMILLAATFTMSFGGEPPAECGCEATPTPPPDSTITIDAKTYTPTPRFS